MTIQVLAVSGIGYILKTDYSSSLMDAILAKTSSINYGRRHKSGACKPKSKSPMIPRFACLNRARIPI